MMTPFVVGRESSVHALEEALAADKKIFLATSMTPVSTSRSQTRSIRSALRSLERVRAKYPRDRVVLNQIGRHPVPEAATTPRRWTVLKQVGDVDPEDVQMHYTLMLCYRGLGDEAPAPREEELFRRFKADEASQSITERRRRQKPEDNNERQAIHDHESAVKRRAGTLDGSLLSVCRREPLASPPLPAATPPTSSPT